MTKQEKLKKQIKKTIKDIKSIEIQGATNVAKETVKLVALFLQTFKKGEKVENIIKKLGPFIEKIAYLRITEPLARNGLKYIIFNLNKKQYKTDQELIKAGKKIVEDFLKMIDSHKAKIAKTGEKLIKKNQNVFTHCHSSMVMSVLKAAYKKRKFKVFNDETRPLLQGHLTSKELRSAKIPNTILVDGASPYVISHFSGRDLMMDQIFLGTDAISLDGSCVNKIGSYGVSLSAFYEKVPVYIATSLLKIDYEAEFGDDLEIEERSAKELWENPPAGLKVINLAFDLVPKNFISGYITEYGIIKPKDIKKIILKKYPWLLS